MHGAASRNPRGRFAFVIREGRRGCEPGTVRHDIARRHAARGPVALGGRQTEDRARVAAFGMTRRAGQRCEDDANLAALLEAETPVVTLVGKSSALHVERVLETSREENLCMIADSVAFFLARGKEVIYDAEHFFDGYRLDPVYAVATLSAAAEAGAHCIVLCDTNGGELPDVVGERVCELRTRLDTPLGIHPHNDSALAVA